MVSWGVRDGPQSGNQETRGEERSPRVAGSHYWRGVGAAPRDGEAGLRSGGGGSEVMVEIFKRNATDKAASVDNINKRILYNYFETPSWL